MEHKFKFHQFRAHLSATRLSSSQLQFDIWRKISDKNIFHLVVIKDPTETNDSLYEKAVSIRYLITRLKTLWAPPPFDSASFTFAYCIALSCFFDRIITIRETSLVTRWHGEFHYLSIMTLGFHSTFLTGGVRTPTITGGGGISHGPIHMHISKRQVWLPFKVCLSAIRFPQRS